MTAVSLRAQAPWKCFKDRAAEDGVTYVSPEAGDSDAYGYWERGPAKARMVSLFTQLKTLVGGRYTAQDGQTGQSRAPTGLGEEQCPWLSGEACGPSVTWGCLGFIWA